MKIIYTSTTAYERFEIHAETMKELLDARRELACGVVDLSGDGLVKCIPAGDMPKGKG